MSTARRLLAVASRESIGNHVSPEAPFFLRPWGTSRFPTPLYAPRPEASR